MIDTTVHEAHARLALLDIPSQLTESSALLLQAQDAAVLAELAGYAVRRGFTSRQAMQEIASRHPHKFRKDKAAGLTCDDCGRSEIFSIHERETK